MTANGAPTQITQATLAQGQTTQVVGLPEDDVVRGGSTVELAKIAIRSRSPVEQSRCFAAISLLGKLSPIV